MDTAARRARVIAFYLPQFHPVPENDAWWGPGFTEWTNVAKAKPLFPGHYQPRLPADLGYYDLRVPETRAAQAEMAAAHGVEAFCYWHYWFAGDRLLERPFNEVLRSGEPDFPFCLAWANDSWTGIWHGAPGRILKEQTYPGMADHERHFYTLLEAFSDPRYVRIEGRPLFLVYKPRDLPDARRVTDLWRALAGKSGLKGLHLVGVEEVEGWDPAADGFDGSTASRQSAVLNSRVESLALKLRRRAFQHQAVERLYQSMLGRPTRVYPYAEAARHFLLPMPLGFEYYPCVIPNWDNTARSGVNGLVLHDSTPELFRAHLREALAIADGLPAERRLVFVKSWNEWAEGNYVEPDRRFGLSYLEALRDEVLCGAAARAPLPAPGGMPSLAALSE